MARPRRKRGPVEAAVRRGLTAATRTSGLAAAALELAYRLDREPHPPCEACGCEGAERAGDRDAAAIARELRALLAELAKLAPSMPHKDRVDDLRARRAARLAASNPEPASAG